MDLFGAVGLLVGIVELSDVRVLQSLLGGQTFARVEMEKILHQIKGLVGCRWEHVSEFPGFSWW